MAKTKENSKAEDIKEAMVLEIREEAKRYNAALKILGERCEKAGIEIAPVDIDEFFVLKMPCGRRKRDVSVHDSQSVIELLNIDFEKYTFLDRYAAICSYELGTLEACLEFAGTPISSKAIAFRLFQQRLVNYSNDISDLSITVEQPSGKEGIKISISTPSKECKALLGGRNHNVFTLKLSGLEVSTHDAAVHILEKVGNAFLFQIDLIKNFPLTIARENNGFRVHTYWNKYKQKELVFPTTEYDNEPLSLYWYARSANGLPLLRFLAYYQSIEYYFPVYSEIEAKKTVRNILKSPTFNLYNDTDITKMINAVKAKTGRGYENEKTMLKSTLNECVDVLELREFLKENEELMNFYNSKQYKDLSNSKISMDLNDSDLLNVVAERIYDIRCRIVHTKAVDSSEVELLVPFSKEVDVLSYDIDLVRYISQQVIIASGSQFVI